MAPALSRFIRIRLIRVADGLHGLLLGEGVTVDKAKVTKTDIAASNGVIHVIDTVVMPN